MVSRLSARPTADPAAVDALAGTTVERARRAIKPVAVSWAECPRECSRLASQGVAYEKGRSRDPRVITVSSWGGEGRPAVVELTTNAIAGLRKPIDESDVDLARAVRGRSGGSAPAVPPDQANLLTIVETVEGPSRRETCVVRGGSPVRRGRRAARSAAASRSCSRGPARGIGAVSSVEVDLADARRSPCVRAGSYAGLPHSRLCGVAGWAVRPAGGKWR